VKKEHDNDRAIKQAVKDHYAGLVSGKSCGCCSPTVTGIVGFGQSNYTSNFLEDVPGEAAAYSFGCGNPLAFAGVKEGQTVVDIGSGAGLDVIIASRAVGPEGTVIGLDMTPEMIKQGQENVGKAGLFNVLFVLGEAENIPIDDGIADWVVSNCVINLSPDKEQVFREISRILKPGGQILISDMVVDNLPDQLLESLSAWTGCIAGAIPEKDYLAAVAAAGLEQISVIDRMDYDLSGFKPLLEEYFPGRSESLLAPAKEQGLRVSSIRLSAVKPNE
jgi:SAM-dependent methyltransferase